jgi:hypothetical protein
LDRHNLAGLITLKQREATSSDEAEATSSDEVQPTARQGPVELKDQQLALDMGQETRTWHMIAI